MDIKKRVSGYYDEIAEHYEEDYECDPFWRLYYDITWHNIRKHLPKDRKALIIDVGGGTGFWSRRIAKLGYNVLCTDISERMLEIGRKKAKKEGVDKKIFFTYGDVTNLADRRSSSFDFVLCAGDPISYCANPKKGISELARIAKPGAKIVFSVDNLFNTVRSAIRFGKYNAINKLIKTHKSDLLGHITQYNFTVDELEHIVTGAGLEVLDIIGKPVLLRHSDFDRRPELWKDKKLYKLILGLEIRFGNEPTLVSTGGHLEVVAKKV
jgi:S-adenosylmethionine-dependent methyltransferase